MSENTPTGFSTPESSKLGMIWIGISLLCGTVFFTSTKFLLNNLHMPDFFTWWYGFGLIFHSVYGIKTRGIRLKDLERDQLSMIGIYIVLDLTGAIAFFTALRYMDPAVSSFINQSHIIFTLFAGYILLKEALDFRELGASFIIVIGVVIMTFKSASTPPIALALMLYSNFTAAINLIIVRKVGFHVGTLTFARVRTTALFIIFLGWNLGTQGYVNVPHGAVLLVMLIGSFFGPFLNVVSIYKALEYLPAGKLALLKSSQPLLVMITSAFILHSTPGLRESIGGIIVIFGCILLASFHMEIPLVRRWQLRAPRLQ